MPPQVAAFFGKFGIYIGIVLAVIAVLALTYCKGESAGKSGAVVKEQKRTIQVQQEVGAANENAAGARVADTAKAAQQERELTNALNASKDPNRQRVLRGCLIMRQQGRNTKNIPACR